MIYGYVRVSTDKQTTENQTWEIRQFCQNEGKRVDLWVKETVSATKSLKIRKLGRLIKKLKSGDLLIASELSRIGRNLLEVMSILNYYVNTGATIITIKDNFKLDTGIQSKVLAFAFGLAAEIERNLISQRTKETLAARQARGFKLGRPCGSKSKKRKLSGKGRLIYDLLKKGYSKSAVARKFHIHRETLTNFISLDFSPDSKR